MVKAFLPFFAVFEYFQKTRFLNCLHQNAFTKYRYDEN